MEPYLEKEPFNTTNSSVRWLETTTACSMSHWIECSLLFFNKHHSSFGTTCNDYLYLYNGLHAKGLTKVEKGIEQDRSLKGAEQGSFLGSHYITYQFGSYNRIGSLIWSLSRRSWSQNKNFQL